MKRLVRGTTSRQRDAFAEILGEEDPSVASDDDDEEKEERRDQTGLAAGGGAGGGGPGFLGKKNRHLVSQLKHDQNRLVSTRTLRSIAL